MSRKLRISRHMAAGVAALGTLGLTASASASGFAVARFGGPHGNPTETNPSALYYNPGGIGFVDGHQVTIDINWALRTGTYERGVGALGTPIENPDRTGSNFSEEEIAANTGTAEVNNFLYSPMIGYITDFGTDLPLAVGFAFYAPFGGQSVWDETGPESDEFPGAVDGPQRWYVMEGTIRTLAFTFGAAYVIEQANLSIGVGANLLVSETETIRARNGDGSDRLSSEGRSYVDTSSTDFSIGAGLLWEAIEDRLWLGFSYQSRPNINGEMTFEGTLTNQFPPSETDTDIVLTQQLPDIYRLGGRFRPTSDVEVRLFGDFTRWSAFTNQCIIGQEALGNADPFDYCRLNSDGSLANQENTIVQNLNRGWQDAFGIRLGGSYWFSDKVELMLDFGYDGNAVPDEALEPALQDFHKVSAGIGGEFMVYQTEKFGLELATTFTNIFYFERDTNGVDTANYLGVPLAAGGADLNSVQPSSEGVYNQNIFVWNTAMNLFF